MRSPVVSTTVYLTDYDNVRPTMDPVWHSIMTSAGASLGVRTCIGVAELPAKTDCEFTCIAARRGKVAIPATPAGALYSEAVRLDKAGLAFIAGTTCTNLPKDAGVKAHTEAIFDLISQRLARLKLDFSDLVAVSGCRPLSGVAPYTLSDHSLADSDLPCQLQGGFCRRERGLHEGP